MNHRIRTIHSCLSYLPSSTEPLSAEVFLIRGETFTYVYDVGANEESRELLHSIPNKKIILSHFHQDHSKNIFEADYEQLWVDRKTGAYLRRGEILQERQEIRDGVRLEIIPTVTSHSKSALLLNVNGDYLLTGDALYTATVKGRPAYNVQMLRELIQTIKNIETETVILSHDKQFFYRKADVLAELEGYYAKREKDNPYIFTD